MGIKYISINDEFVNFYISITTRDRAFHTTHVVCVNFIYENWDLQFKVDSEQQIFEKLLKAILFTLRVIEYFCHI